MVSSLHIESSVRVHGVSAVRRPHELKTVNTFFYFLNMLNIMVAYVIFLYTYSRTLCNS